MQEKFLRNMQARRSRQLQPCSEPRSARPALLVRGRTTFETRRQSGLPCKFAVTPTVEKIDHKPDRHPNDQPQPSVARQAYHEKNAERDPQWCGEPECWRSKRSLNIRVGEPKDENPGT